MHVPMRLSKYLQHDTTETSEVATINFVEVDDLENGRAAIKAGNSRSPFISGFPPTYRSSASTFTSFHSACSRPSRPGAAVYRGQEINLRATLTFRRPVIFQPTTRLAASIETSAQPTIRTRGLPKGQKDGETQIFNKGQVWRENWLEEDLQRPHQRYPHQVFFRPIISS